MLTDKAKIDFLDWVQKQSYYTDNSNHLIKYENSERGEFIWYGNETNLLKEPKFLNTLIIEWFDSVKIFIGFEPYNTDSQITRIETNVSIEYKESVYLSYEFSQSYLTRQEATTQAIIKANEIYNNNQKK